MLQPPPTSPLFPYTTLFRSAGQEERIDSREQPGDEQNRAEELGVRREIAEKNRDVVARQIGGERGRAAVSEDLRVADLRSEEHTSELQSRVDLVCRLLLEKK